MRTVCTSSPAVIVAGSGAALGRVRPADGGWRLSGRWPFVTGGPAADEIVVGATVEGPRPRPLCFCLVPAADVEILDTWDTVGLRGTGSHDIAVHDVFVPAERAGVVRSGRDTLPDATLFRLPPALRFPFPKVGVATGIARAAIAAFTELAEGKKARVSRTLLRERPDAQLRRRPGRGTGRLGLGVRGRDGRDDLGAGRTGRAGAARRPRPDPAGLHPRGRQLRRARSRRSARPPGRPPT